MKVKEQKKKRNKIDEKYIKYTITQIKKLEASGINILNILPIKYENIKSFQKYNKQKRHL